MPASGASTTRLGMVSPPSCHGSVSDRTPSRVRRPMAYDLVIFDCDGVLVDSEPLSNRILAERLTAIGLPTTVEEAIRDYMGRSWKSDQEVIEGRLGRPLPDGWVDAYHAEVIAAFETELQPVAGIAAALEEIDAPWCVASSTAHPGGAARVRAALALRGPDLQRDRRRARQAGARPVPARRARVRRGAGALRGRRGRSARRGGRPPRRDGRARLRRPDGPGAAGGAGRARLRVDGRAAGAAQRLRSQMSRSPVSVSRSSTSSMRAQ